MNLRFAEGDAESIAPSLYTNRAGRRKSAAAEQLSVSEAAPSTSNASDGVQPVPSEASAARPPPPIVIDNVAGLPIDDPFVN